MIYEKVGTVTKNEKREIQDVFERINGIEELKYTLDNEKLDANIRDEILNKIHKELPRLRESYEDWWKLMSEKYNWEKPEDKKWTIRFDTNEVFITQ